MQMGADEPWKIIDHEEWAAGLRRHGALCYMLALRGSKEDVSEFLNSIKK